MASVHPKAAIELPPAVRPKRSEADASTSRSDHDTSTLIMDRTASADSARPLLANPVDFARQWLHKVPDDADKLDSRSPSLEASFMSGTMTSTMSRSAKSPTKFRPSISAVKKASKQGLILRRAASMTGEVPAIVTASEPSHSLTATPSVFQQLEKANRPQWKAKACDLLDGTHISCFVVFVTLLAVFLDDFRLAVLPPAADPVCVGITIVVLVVFVLDTTAGSIVRPGYAFRFYWLIDFVATLSMLLDIPAVVNGLNRISSSSSTIEADEVSFLARGTSNTSANKARQIMRVCRILRLMRLVYLYNQYELHKQVRTMEIQGGLTMSKPAQFGQRAALAGTRVGQKLSHLTTRRVIIGVLGLLLFIPCFELSSGLYGDYPPMNEAGLQMLHDMYLDTGNTTGFWEALQAYQGSSSYRLGMKMTDGLHSLAVCNDTFVDVRNTYPYRSYELLTVQEQTSACGLQQWASCLVTTAVFDVRWNSRFGAALNLFRSLFVIVALGCGAVLFNNDSNRLVLRPIERMLRKVRDVSENPLAKPETTKHHSDDPQMETRILENSINKICSLLAVGFGDAGAEVIANNIRSGGDLNPMIPGNKVVAIFGFCDIRNFTDTTEVLQEDIMEFVNTIADIVHTEVALHGGAPNKNIGDAFLLVWKFPKGCTMEDIARVTSAPDSESTEKPRSRSTVRYCQVQKSSRSRQESELDWQIREVADRALAAFVVIQAAIKRSQRLQSFCQREDLLERMPGYQVKMGFGLHVGWAIEGAIGSKFKIDASYLSPNVNMASRLEAATKQFGSTILISGDFVKLLSPALKRRVRQVDCVTVKGSNKPMDLFTYDVSLDRIPIPAIQADQHSIAEAAPAPPPNVTFSMKAMENEFVEHPDLMSTWAVTTPFLKRFQQGFELYRSGQWAEAKAILEETQVMRKHFTSGDVVVDGPSNTLLGVMSQHGHMAPEYWAGFRELTEK